MLNNLTKHIYQHVNNEDSTQVFEGFIRGNEDQGC